MESKLKLVKNTLGVVVTVFFAASIISWIWSNQNIFVLQEDTPVLSLFTSINFLLLFFVRFFLTDNNYLVQKKHMPVMFILCTLIYLLSALQLLMHVSNMSQLFGYVISSVPTLIIFILFTSYELYSKVKNDVTLLCDTFLFVGILWSYLAICGYLFSAYFLTGMLAEDNRIGLSLPTALGFSLYSLVVALSDKSTLTKKLYSRVPWTRKFIIMSIIGLVFIPFSLIVILEMTSITREDYATLYYIFSLWGLTFLLYYIAFIKMVSKTHAHVQAICSYTKQLKSADGEWIPIEKFFSDHYGIDLSHSLSPEGIQVAKAKAHEEGEEFIG